LHYLLIHEAKFSKRGQRRRIEAMENQYAVCIVALLGAGSLLGFFLTKKLGWGPYNLKVVGLILVATFATILAVAQQGHDAAAIGILGTVAGYLFGTKIDGDTDK
jgi:hypothetical protein